MKIEFLLLKLSKPAQHAFQAAGINTLEQLQNLTEKELLGLHGIGNKAIITIKSMLSENGTHLKDEQNRGIS